VAENCDHNIDPSWPSIGTIGVCSKIHRVLFFKKKLQSGELKFTHVLLYLTGLARRCKSCLKGKDKLDKKGLTPALAIKSGEKKARQIVPPLSIDLAT
jgi:hypothetical protein